MFFRNIALLTLLILQTVKAQQDPQYTQYMYTMNIVNPAYAGITDNLAIGSLYRSQWVGLEGGPRTFTFSIHSKIEDAVGLGLSLIADEIGPVKETNAYIDLSYIIPISSNTNLAFGFKAGFTFHDIGISQSQINIIDQNDPFFSNNLNEATPNFGVGIYLYQPNNYYLSLSIPNLLNAIHLDLNGTKIGTETQHLFAAIGYVIDLSQNFKIKPHIFSKYAFNAPVSFDVNANLFMYDLVEIGLGYRLDDSLSAMINFQVTPNLRIGYAYDGIRSELDIVTNSSHELFLNIEFHRQKRIRSPRYF